MTGAPPPRRGGSLASRLLAAQLLVVLAGALTAWLVTVTVGPPLFRRHLADAGADVPPTAVVHAQEAYRSATLISLTVALLVAGAAAATVSTVVTRRIGRGVAGLAAAAHEVADGRLDARVPAPGLGAEFEELADAFNRMARRLAASETVRQQLLADLAHEMRTPVAVISAYLDGLADGIRTADRDTLAVLATQTDRLARLADDLATISHADERGLDLHPVPCRPADLVTAAAAAAQPAFQSVDVTLTVEVSDGLPNVLADPDRIGQVLANLLDNARRHTPPGGHVAVSATGQATTVTIQVTDTGQGIPGEDLPRVFDRFYRVDAARDRAHTAAPASA